MSNETYDEWIFRAEYHDGAPPVCDYCRSPINDDDSCDCGPPEPPPGPVRIYPGNGGKPFWRNRKGSRRKVKRRN
jgi:hypothetical protein